MHQTADPEPLGSERYERLVRAVDDHFEKVDTLVGARVVRGIEETGLDLHEARVLLALSGAKEAMKAGEIAKLSGLDLDSAYQAVHSLHGRGLTCEDARRHKLTARGRGLMKTFGQAREGGVRSYVKSLPEEEQRRLERALRPAA